MHRLILTAAEIEERLKIVPSLDVFAAECTIEGTLIRVDINHTIKDGSEIKFKSPADCSQITGLIVYYSGEDSTVVSREFALADAHGNNVGNIDYLFAENAVVKVILDLDTNMAFVQNADTNAYLEEKLASKLDEESLSATTVLGFVKKGEGTNSVIVGEAEATGAESLAFGVNSRAIAPASMALGINVEAGCYGYYIWDVDFETNQITLATKQNTVYGEERLLPTNLSWTAGDIISIFNRVGYANCATITAIDTDNYIITLDSLPAHFKKAGLDKPTEEKPLDRLSSHYHSIYLIARPEDGEVLLTKGGFARGVDSKALGHWSTAIGRENIAADTCSFVTGSGNIGSYCALVGGSNNKVLREAGFSAGIDNTITAAYGSTLGEKNTVTGYAGTALGFQNKVNVQGGFAAGYNNEVNYEDNSENNSIALGASNKVAGYAAFAAGQGNTATANAATAFGKSNTASATTATAFGESNTASAPNATAFGKSNTVSGECSVAMGLSNTVSQSSSLAVGTSNKINGTQPASAIIGSSNTINNAYYSVVAGNLNYLGYQEDVDKEPFNTGYTLVAGSENTVKANSAAVFGRSHTVAKTALYSVIGGYKNNVSAEKSAAFGDSNTVSGISAAAFGNGNAISGATSVAVGTSNSIAAANSGAIGSKNKILGQPSTFAAGESNTNNAYYSAALGYGNKLGWLSGDVTKPDGTAAYSTGYCAAIGDNNTIKANNSIALGSANEIVRVITPNATNPYNSNTKYSIVGGYKNISYCNGGIAFGKYNEVGSKDADIYCAMAIGDHLIARKNNALVLGKYNLEDDSNDGHAIIVGGGKESARKNIAKLDWAGNAWFADKVTVGGSGNGIGALTLATESYVDEHINSTSSQATLENAKTYTDMAVQTVKNDLLNGAGEAYDTLKELGALIDTNTSALEALNTVAAGKASVDELDALADEVDQKVSNISDTLQNSVMPSIETLTEHMEDVNAFIDQGAVTVPMFEHHLSAQNPHSITLQLLGIPEWSIEDEGKVLQIVNGKLAWVAPTIIPAAEGREF